MSLAPIADGDLAAVVTYLEMLDAPDRPAGASPLALRRIEYPAAADYRALFKRVGAPWLWFSRLLMDEAELEDIIHDPAIELYAVLDQADHQCGMLELDFREPGQCELAFVGLVPEWSGKGHGRWLLAEALRLAWPANTARKRIRRDG